MQSIWETQRRVSELELTIAAGRTCDNFSFLLLQFICRGLPERPQFVTADEHFGLLGLQNELAEIGLGIETFVDDDAVDFILQAIPVSDNF